jgi:DNA repair photolyase
MIISASRRTDIPAFYGRWFLKRLEAGYCEVANPFNPKQVSRISLVPEDVDALVFWTRYPASLMDALPHIRGRGYHTAFLYTIVDYPEILEPAAPPLEKRIEAFKGLVRECGSEAVVWRYDPVILSDLTPSAYHVERFTAIADALQGFTNRVIVSLFAPYRSVLRRLEKIPEINIHEHDEATARDTVQTLAAEAQTRGLEMQSCADPRIEAVAGVRPGACISEDLLRGAGTIPQRRAANQRRHCRCLESRDIGAYETCLFNCRYCYATHDPDTARANSRRHDPNAAMLIPTAAADSTSSSG